MADRRMFAKTILLSDAFIDLPHSARSLYVALGMVADDDGFINNPRSIMRQVESTREDLDRLIQEEFIIPFESGVVAIKAWKVNNLIQKDRYKPTKYVAEKAQLNINEKSMYTLCIHSVSNPDTNCIQTVSKVDTQGSIGKESLGKDSLSSGCIVHSNNINSATTTAAAQIVKDWGKDVIRLTDTEREDLFKKLGADHFKTYINKLASFITGKGASVSNHYGTVLKWYEEDKAKGKVKNRYGSFDPNDAMQRAIDRSYRKDINDDE